MGWKFIEILWNFLGPLTYGCCAATVTAQPQNALLSAASGQDVLLQLVLQPLRGQQCVRVVVQLQLLVLQDDFAP